jgi:predicted TIM-barrel fold metal-dependent hydrolase
MDLLKKVDEYKLGEFPTFARFLPSAAQANFRESVMINVSAAPGDSGSVVRFALFFFFEMAFSLIMVVV